MPHEEPALDERTARDDEDARLLAEGDHAALLAAYYPTILLRLRIRRLQLDEAEEVRQRVVEHLLRQLRAAGHSGALVSSCINGRRGARLLRGAEAPGGRASEEQAGDSVDEFERIESNLDFDRLLADLPGRERQVAALRWQHGLEVPQIAEIVGIETNAVHQALFRAHRKLSEKLG